MAATGWFAIIDCAQDERLLPLVRQCRDAACLFRDPIDPALAATAPWLVRIDDADPLPAIWQAHGMGLNWGVRAASPVDLATLRNALRRFTQARLPDGTVALFRFYDPRVLRTFLPATLPAERAPWFTHVSHYVVEEEDTGTMHQFHIDGDRLMDGNHHVA